MPGAEKDRSDLGSATDRLGWGAGADCMLRCGCSKERDGAGAA
jgi:hypothetical protein